MLFNIYRGLYKLVSGRVENYWTYLFAILVRLRLFLKIVLQILLAIATLMIINSLPLSMFFPILIQLFILIKIFVTIYFNPIVNISVFYLFRLISI